MSRFVDLYSDQDIDRDTFLERKRALMSERKSAEEQITRLERDHDVWLQPLRDFINEASVLDEIRKSSDLPSKKSSAPTFLYIRAKRAERLYPNTLRLAQPKIILLEFLLLGESDTNHLGRLVAIILF